MRYPIPVHMNIPTPRPPTNPVIKRLGFVEGIFINFCKDQSISIIMISIEAIYKDKRWPTRKSMKETTCPKIAPTHLAQVFIRFPLMMRHLSGIPWHPKLKYLILFKTPTNFSCSSSMFFLTY